MTRHLDIRRLFALVTLAVVVFSALPSPMALACSEHPHSMTICPVEHDHALCASATSRRLVAGTARPLDFTPAARSDGRLAGFSRSSETKPLDRIPPRAAPGDALFGRLII